MYPALVYCGTVVHERFFSCTSALFYYGAMVDAAAPQLSGLGIIYVAELLQFECFYPIPFSLTVYTLARF